MATEIQTAESTSTESLKAGLMAKFEQKLNGLIEEGLIRDGATLTNFDARVEYGNGSHVEWVTDDGQRFVTKSNSREYERPHAPVIPSAVKKLNTDQSDKAVEKAVEAVRKVRLGIYAMRESRLCTSKPPRTLPGIAGKAYSSDRQIAEFQKYADAGEKIGL
jgi:hypothetical protein